MYKQLLYFNAYVNTMYKRYSFDLGGKLQVRNLKTKRNILKHIISSFIMPIILAILIILNGETTSLAADNINVKLVLYNTTKTILESQKYFNNILEENNEIIENTQEMSSENASVEMEETISKADATFISKLNTTNNKIALTFDDCNNRANMEEILNILFEENVKATFFVTGDTIERYPDMLSKIVDNGNSIGNHSYSHSDFTVMTYEEIKEEVEKTEEAIKKLTGKSTKPMFRPPYGRFNDEVINILGDLGFTDFVYWSIDTRDWSGISADDITYEVLSNAKPGAIVLMHASYGAKNTPAALPEIIKGLRDKGYEFVTFDE